MKTKYWRLVIEKEVTSAEKNIIEKAEEIKKSTDEPVEEATSEINEDIE